MRVKGRVKKLTFIKKKKQKTTKFTACSSITSWQVEGEKVEIDFILLGFKITVNIGCSHEIKDTCSLEEKL